MTDALTSLESWMRGLRKSFTDAALAVHGSAVPKAVPPEALAKVRCTLFAANNALEELVDQLKGRARPSESRATAKGRQTEPVRQASVTR